jgi:hypothetical protein
MTRWIVAALAVGAITAVSAQGCANTGVGDPCTPDAEYSPQFGGFQVGEVSIESRSFVCLSRLCLVNHFQGRVSCPYGQVANPANASLPVTDPGHWESPTGAANGTVGGPGGAGCFVPGTVTLDGGGGTAQTIQQPVPAQLTGTGSDGADRTAAKAVYCSCRCANQAGQQNDGANYCSCPDGFTCTQLVTSIGEGNTGLTGAYCVKNGTQYESRDPCTPCNPNLGNCGAAPGVKGG